MTAGCCGVSGVCLQDYVDQLKLIIKVLGPPSEDDLSFINSSKARAYIRALPQQEVSWAGAACGQCADQNPCVHSRKLRRGMQQQPALHMRNCNCMYQESFCPIVSCCCATSIRSVFAACVLVLCCVPCSACRGRRSSRRLTLRRWTSWTRCCSSTQGSASTWQQHSSTRGWHSCMTRRRSPQHQVGQA